jgi:membrane protein
MSELPAQNSPTVAACVDNSEMPVAVSWAMEKLPVLRLPIYFVWRLVTRWGEDQCPVKAAAMAFFGLLSIFPMVLAAVSILATTLAGNTAALQGFQTFVEQFFPGQTGQDVSNAMKNAVEKIADGPSITVLSIIALGSLIWSGRAYFATLAEVLNSVWPGARQRTFWQNQIVLWSTFVGAGVLWLLSTALTFFLSLTGWLLKFLPNAVQNALPWLAIVSQLSSLLLTVLMFWLIYRFLPNVQGLRRRRLVWGAALLAAFLWELAKLGFAQFLGNLDRYQATYGSVAGVVVTMMWIYISSLIILLGAEAAAAYEETCDDCPAANQPQENSAVA